MIYIFCYGILINGLDDTPVENSLVVIQDRNIAYAGSFDQNVYDKYEKDVRSKVLEIAGKTILPGLIDAHVHLTMYGQPSAVMDMVTDSATYTALKAAENAKKLLLSGFTTIRCCGEKGEVDFAVKRAVNEGMIMGPRVLASGKALSMTGGHGDFLPGDLTIDGISETVDGMDEVRRATRKRLKNNADSIKLMATGGGTSPGPGTVAQFSIDEMCVAVEEAAKRNTVTAAHSIGTDGINNALKAGVNTIEHGTFLNDESIDMLVNGKDQYLVPTLVAFRTLWIGEKMGVPQHHLEKVRFYATKHMTNLQKAVKAGVKIVCGTDSGTPYNYHGDGMEEFELYTKNGMTPMQALKAGCYTAAKALRQDDIGSLEEGKTADLLVVDGNVLDDIRLLQNKDNLRVIMRNGDFCKNTL